MCFPYRQSAVLHLPLLVRFQSLNWISAIAYYGWCEVHNADVSCKSGAEQTNRQIHSERKIAEKKKKGESAMSVRRVWLLRTQDSNGLLKMSLRGRVLCLSEEYGCSEHRIVMAF